MEYISFLGTKIKLTRIIIYLLLGIICSDYNYDTTHRNKVVDVLTKLGVKSIDFSYISPIGRAEKNICEKDYVKRYDFSKNDNRFKVNENNCGLLFKHTCIDPLGNLRPCALFNDKIEIGNIFKDKHALYIKKYIDFYNLPSPSKKICKKCKLLSYCVGCIYKGLYNSNTKCSYRLFVKSKYPNIENICKK